MKISIVMPVYNGERYLAGAIRSVLEQSYPDFELIIVNDASIDGSLKIAEAFAAKDDRIRVYTNEHNQKLPRSLNIGFSHCEGELYTWTSDDNLLLPEFCEEMHRAFIEHPEADVVFARMNNMDENGRVFGTTQEPGELNNIYIRNIVAACFMYRRKVQEELGGYDETKFLVEDYDFWLRAYEKYQFYYLPKILYSYRYHESSLTSRRWRDIKLRSALLLEDIEARTTDPHALEKIQTGLSGYYQALSHYYFQQVRAAGNSADCRHLLKDRGRKFISELIKR